MRIAVIGAMELEIELLRDELSKVEITTMHGFEFYEGFVGNISVIVSRSGIGKVSASVAAALVINQYKPSLVINTGTAGGLGATEVYDLVLASEVGHHDVDLTAFGYSMGQQAQMPRLFSADNHWLEQMERVLKKRSDKFHKGLVVSGDSFIHSPERLKQIVHFFPDALAVEMEAAAIAQTCFLMNTPFVMLRAISDKAGIGNALSYEQFVTQAGRISAQINIDFLRNL